MANDYGPYADQEVRNQPSLGQTLTGLVSGLIPGYSSDEPWYQKVPDLLSLPARALVQGNPLVQGGQAMDRWMAGDQGPETQHAIGGSVLGLAAGGLGRPTQGPASFGAWHGSRHLFEGTPENPLGAFKPIEEVASTGEGTQAYAYGHYVAGAKKTAETYKTAGGDPYSEMGVHKIDNIPVKPYNYQLDPEDMPVYHALNFLGDFKGDHDAAIHDLHEEARSRFDSAQMAGRGSVLGSAGSPETNDLKRAWLLDSQDHLRAARWLDENRKRVSWEPSQEGHLYQVSVRPDEHELLDWDKPLSEQHPGVQDKMRDILKGMIIPGTDPAVVDRMSGAFLYRKIAEDAGRGTGQGTSPEVASQTLHTLGIPGVKFLDANSRNIGIKIGPGTWQVTNDSYGRRVLSSYATKAEAEAAAEAQRTRNYVIFHHSNLKVVDRDGVAHGLEPVDHDPVGRTMSQDRPTRHAHKMVREVAVAMAHELYDTMMLDNQWYKVWKKQNPGLGVKELEQRFVDKNLEKLIPQARATLAGMLHPGVAPSLTEGQKEEIYEALTLDATLIRGRVN